MCVEEGVVSGVYRPMVGENTTCTRSRGVTSVGEPNSTVTLRKSIS